jgi:hypothetical protein
MSFQCQSEILDILLTCNKMSVVGIVKKNGYPKFLSINSPNKFSNRWMVILGKKMLDPKKRVLAFKIERLAYVM